MQGVLFVLHGRRSKIAQQNFAAVEKVGEQLTANNLVYGIGLLEGEQQTLEEGLKELADKKVTEFILVPVLLFPATHVQEDLPKRAYKVLGEEAKLQVLEPLGTTEGIYQELKKQLAAGLANHPEKSGLLIAHGTPHYSLPGVQLQNIAQKMSQELQLPIFGANYIGDENYQGFIKAHETEGFVIQPFFLTHGHLVIKINRWIVENHPMADVFLPTLQESPALVAALTERLVAAGCIPSY